MLCRRHMDPDLDVVMPWRRFPRLARLCFQGCEKLTAHSALSNWRCKRASMRTLPGNTLKRSSSTDTPPGRQPPRKAGAGRPGCTSRHPCPPGPWDMRPLPLPWRSIWLPTVKTLQPKAKQPGEPGHVPCPPPKQQAQPPGPLPAGQGLPAGRNLRLLLPKPPAAVWLQRLNRRDSVYKRTATPLN